MTLRTSIVIVSTATTLAVAGLILHAGLLRRELAQRRIDSAKMLAALADRRAAAIEALRADERLQGSDPVPPAHSQPGNAQPRAATDSPGRIDGLARERTLADNPELQILREAAERPSRYLNYAAFARSQGLSAEDTAALDRILSERDTARRDFRRSIDVQGLRSDDPAAQALRADFERATHDALCDLLGEAAVAHFIDYERTVELRQPVATFVVAAMMCGAPLSSAQTEQLVHVLAESHPLHATGSSVSIAGVDWEKAAPRLQAMLTPAQYAQISQTETNALGNTGTSSRFEGAFMLAVEKAARGEQDPAP